MKRLWHHTFREYLLVSELAALLVISTILFIGLWLVLEQSDAAYLHLRLADAQKVHLFLENQIIETGAKMNVFTSFPERERTTSAHHLFDDFADIYLLDDDRRVARIYKAAPGSKVFKGFSFAGGKLGAYIQGSQGEPLFSGIVRSYEDGAPGMYYAHAHLGRKYLARINLNTLQRFLQEFSRFSGTPIMIVAQDGFVMVASDPELNIYALDLATWNTTPSARHTLNAGNRTWIPAISASGKMNAQVVILIPTTVPDLFQRALVLLYAGGQYLVEPLLR